MRLREALYSPKVGLAGMNPYKEEIAKVTNRRKLSGKLADVIKGADVFVGLSVSRMCHSRDGGRYG